jgi:hypothetical protein
VQYVPTRGGIEVNRYFEKQFEPFEDGYLYYSGRQGGKFVHKEEFEALWAQHKRWMRWSIIPTLVILCVDQFIRVVAGLERGFSIVAVVASVAITVAFVVWLSLAPARLVKDREVIAPPRSLSSARRTARDMIPWWMVAVALAGSALVLGACLLDPLYSLSWWLWTLGSGAMLLVYLWTAAAKFRDRSSASQ